MTRGYASAMPKRRLDTVLAERGLFPSRSRAAAAVLAGEVRVGGDGRPSREAGPARARTTWRSTSRPPRFVSRGGIKLANALNAFGLDPAGRHCLDVGASTGGFTDCLLQRGAAAVAALDVAYGELDWRLRQDPRVTVIERQNARSSRPRRAAVRARPRGRGRLLHLPGEGPPGGRWTASRRRFDCLALVKPQFEVGRERVGKGGVVRDAERAPWRARRRRRGGREAGWASRAGLRVVGPARARRATARASSGSPRRAGEGRSRTSTRPREGPEP